MVGGGGGVNCSCVVGGSGGVNCSCVVGSGGVSWLYGVVVVEARHVRGSPEDLGCGRGQAAVI